MDDIRAPHPDDPTPGSGATSARLRLEVDLLRAAEPRPPAPPDATPGAAPRTVLVALGELDLVAYVRRCLAAYPGLVVVEPDAGEHALAAARRLSPALLIAEPGTVGVPPPPLAVPLLLLVEEWPDGTAPPPSPASPFAFLVCPFNAGRLLAAVEPLLGPPDGP
jgi:hypothetical protein